MVNLIIFLGILDYFNIIPALDTTIPINAEVWFVILICVWIFGNDD